LHLAALLFKAALQAPIKIAGRLFRLSFDPIHSAAASGHLDYGIRSSLGKRLPLIGLFNEWDFCAKLKAAVSKRYIESGVLDASILLVTDNRQALEALLWRIRSEWRGSALLEGLVDQVRASSLSLEQFRLETLARVARGAYSR
jgi:hypothetical protein